MKKIRNVGLILGMIILLSTNSKAQYFYTSYGYTQDWYIPEYIDYTIQDQYYGYQIAHVQRYTHPGYTNFNVLLYRDGSFLEVRFDRYGYIYRTIRHRRYPLISHRCSGYCGFHQTYYKTYYPKYYHKYQKTVYVNTHSNHGYRDQNHRKQNNYYTNVYVEKPQKKQNHYQGNQQSQNRVNNSSNRSTVRNYSGIRKPRQSNRQTQNNVNIRTNSSKQRNATVIRKPQQPNRKVEQVRSRGTRTVHKVQQNRPQKRYTKQVNKTSRTNVVSRLN